MGKRRGAPSTESAAPTTNKKPRAAAAGVRSVVAAEQDTTADRQDRQRTAASKKKRVATGNKQVSSISALFGDEGEDSDSPDTTPRGRTPRAAQSNKTAPRRTTSGSTATSASRTSSNSGLQESSSSESDEPDEAGSTTSGARLVESSEDEYEDEQEVPGCPLGDDGLPIPALTSLQKKQQTSKTKKQKSAAPIDVLSNLSLDVEETPLTRSVIPASVPRNQPPPALSKSRKHLTPEEAAAAPKLFQTVSLLVIGTPPAGSASFRPSTSYSFAGGLFPSSTDLRSLTSYAGEFSGLTVSDRVQQDVITRQHSFNRTVRDAVRAIVVPEFELGQIVGTKVEWASVASVRASGIVGNDFLTSEIWITPRHPITVPPTPINRNHLLQHALVLRAAAAVINVAKRHGAFVLPSPQEPLANRERVVFGVLLLAVSAIHWTLDCAIDSGSLNSSPMARTASTSSSDGDSSSRPFGRAPYGNAESFLTCYRRLEALRGQTIEVPAEDGEGVQEMTLAARMVERVYEVADASGGAGSGSISTTMAAMAAATSVAHEAFE